MKIIPTVIIVIMKGFNKSTKVTTLFSENFYMEGRILKIREGKALKIIKDLL